MLIPERTNPPRMSTAAGRWGPMVTGGALGSVVDAELASAQSFHEAGQRVRGNVTSYSYMIPLTIIVIADCRVASSRRA